MYYGIYNTYACILPFFVAQGRWEWVDGDGWVWMSFPFREHPCYLILNIRRPLKHKIYFSRSGSLLGFVASYMKNAIKMEQSQVGSAPLVVWALLDTSPCSRLPCHRLVSAPSPFLLHLNTLVLASTPLPHLHTALVSISTRLLGFPGSSIRWPFTGEVREGGIWLGDFVAITHRGRRCCRRRRCRYAGSSS